MKERKGNALALGAEEGRSDLRKATVSRKQAPDPWMPEWGNPAGVKSGHPMLNQIGIGREPPELKHLSRARKRHQPRFPE